MMLNIKSKVKRGILNYFFLNEENKVYINELARLLGQDPKNVFRVLVQLNQEGLLKSEYKGKERYFFLDKKYPFFKAYKEIFQKSAGLENILLRCISKIPNIKEAYIYGSYAAGKFTQQSDLDVLLIGEHKTLEAQKIIMGIEKNIGRQINVINITQKELIRRQKNNDQLFANIFNKKRLRIL